MTSGEESLIVEKHSGNQGGLGKWVVLFVITASFATVGKGMLLSIHGPALRFLASNTDANVYEVSYLYSGRSFGTLVGAVTLSLMRIKFKDMKTIPSIGFALLVIGCTAASIPLAHSVILLVALDTLIGIMQGFSHCGLQSFYLSKWGQTASRPFIQLHHFSFSVGNFLGPIIEKPLLDMAGNGGNAHADCEKPSASYPHHQNSTFSDDSVARVLTRPVGWTFVIVGIFVTLGAVLFCLLTPCKVEEKITDSNNKCSELRPERPLKELWLFLVAIFLFKFSGVSIRMVYQGYIYGIAACSSLQMSVTKASLLNSLFWGAVAIGRGSGVFASKCLTPFTMIVADLFGSTLATILMVVWGESSENLTWFASFLLGLSVATLLPSGISWASQFTNMTGRYVFLFMAGECVGSIVMMPAGGFLFHKKPYSVIHLVLGSCIASFLFFALMRIISTKL